MFLKCAIKKKKKSIIRKIRKIIKNFPRPVEFISN